MSNKIIYGSDAKLIVKEGIDSIANAVKVTLGPLGQTVLIDSAYEESRVTKDGVSVAKSIILADKVKNAGAKIIKKVATKTADDAGDGTTTATVIAQYLVEHGSKLIASGVNPMELKRGIDEAVKDTIHYFKEVSKKVVSASELREIATISANGDEEIGKIVADVINQVGSDGVVTIETSKTFNTYVDRVQGLRFDRGFISPYFITDRDNGLAELQNPYILITDQKISTVAQIKTVLEYIAQKHAELLIICDDLQGEALNMLVINKIRGTLKTCVVKCPAFGERKTKELDDIAALTGATVVAQDLGYSLEAPGIIDALGTAGKVTVDAKFTTIIDGNGDKQKVDERVESIKKEIELETSSYNKDILRNRLAKLVGGVAILNVGAITEMELGEKKDRIDDALCAARAANEEGTLPGGGIAYINAISHLNHTVSDNEVSPDFSAGYRLVISALKAPLNQIVDNGYGEGEGRVIVSYLLKKKAEDVVDDLGYNARTGKYCQLRSEGIIDPTKVCRVAVENAASIVGMYLTTGCIIVDEEEEDKKEVM